MAEQRMKTEQNPSDEISQLKAQLAQAENRAAEAERLYAEAQKPEYKPTAYIPKKGPKYKFKVSVHSKAASKSKFPVPEPQIVEVGDESDAKRVYCTNSTYKGRQLDPMDLRLVVTCLDPKLAERIARDKAEHEARFTVRGTELKLVGAA